MFETGGVFVLGFTVFISQDIGIGRSRSFLGFLKSFEYGFPESLNVCSSRAFDREFGQVSKLYHILARILPYWVFGPQLIFGYSSKS